MARQRYHRRALKWGGALLCAALLCCMLANRYWEFGWFSSDRAWGVAVTFNALMLYVGSAAGPHGHIELLSNSGWSVSDVHMTWETWLYGWWPISRFWPGWETLDGDFFLWLPLWLVFVPTAGATIWLWWCDRRRKSAGFCPMCGYDLTGNVSGVCPECGTALDRPHVDSSSARSG